MPDHLKATLRTTRGDPAPVDLRCTCDDIWSVAQHQAMARLYARAEPTRAPSLDLRRSLRIVPRFAWEVYRNMPLFGPAIRGFEIDQRTQQSLFYAARARLIAGAYACVFLEHFEQGNPALQGRFYWAGLAAFASKQVACVLETPGVPTLAAATVSALGKGNLWLYNDAWPWHFAWALCPKSVRMCMEKRQAPDLHPKVLQHLLAQEWAEEVLPSVPWHIDEQTGEVGAPIGQLRIAPLMREAIELWDTLANETDPTEVRRLQLAHLMAMARHEQGEVLQGLLYSDPAFQKDLELARIIEEYTLVDRITPAFRLQLSFSAEAYVEDPVWRSDAPKGIRLHRYKERMKWIECTAGQYHKLMNSECRTPLLQQLRILAAVHA